MMARICALFLATMSGCMVPLIADSFASGTTAHAISGVVLAIIGWAMAVLFVWPFKGTQ